MKPVGVLARFDFRPGREQVAADFFRRGAQIVEGQPPGTVWFAYRLSATSYGAFAAFDSEADRAALLAAGGPKLSAEAADAFTTAPVFQAVDIVASRLDAGA